MNDREKTQTDIQPRDPAPEAKAGDSVNHQADAPNPKPQPSYGEITEGESGASLWQTIKIALYD